MMFKNDGNKSINELLKPKTFKYADVKHKLEKVAFDIVRFVDKDGLDGLWQIQNTDDGEVIVAKYEEAVKTASVKEDNNWDVILDDDCDKVSLYYKKEAVARIDLKSCGIDQSEAHLVENYLPKKLSTDSLFRNKLFNTLPKEDFLELKNKFPELA